MIAVCRRSVDLRSPPVGWHPPHCALPIVWEGAEKPPVGPTVDDIMPRQRTTGQPLTPFRHSPRGVRPGPRVEIHQRPGGDRKALLAIYAIERVM